MLTILYTTFIYPLVLIIEISFQLFDKIFKNTSIAILGVSCAVTFLCLPLYMIAEKWQKTERETQKRLAPMVNNIKSVFKGDERFMLLQEFYRQNSYHPLYALRNSFGILIQVPFFIAAYSYLSHLEVLKGVSLFFIRDLGAPDAYTHIGGFNINILPILMTVINIASGIIYTRGLMLRDKLQLFGMAGLFLLLLYNSPAGLVIYWTMNNIFSLCKNIFYKLKNPLQKLYIISATAIIIFILYMIFLNKGVIIKRLFVITGVSFLLFTPLLVKLVLFFQKKILFVLIENQKKMNVLFIVLSMTITVLIGLSIPSAVISSSPDEFSFLDNISTPLIYLGHSFLAAFGFFTLWPLCIYFLFGDRIKSLITSFFCFFAFIAMINAYLFQGNYGLISNTFQFNTTGVLNYSSGFSILNAFACLISVSIVVFMLKKRILSQLISLVLIIFITLAAFSSYNLFNIQKSFIRLESLRAKEETVNSLEKVFHLSRDKPNIVVLMADGTINGFLKPIFENRPELYDAYDGFVYYPNTVSFSLHTLMAVPPLWGGFEYTPLEMNKRNTVTQREKHNQALLLLPTILADLDYEVTVTDPSWSNYEWISDVTIYNNLNNIKAFNTIGRYTSYWFQENPFGDVQVISNTIKRNSFFFSFVKIIIPPLRFVIYDKGSYWGAANQDDFITDFIDNYAVLNYLPKLTSLESSKSQALLITNETAHQPFILQYPDYKPVPEVTDFGPEPFSFNKSYHINAAMIIQLGRWFEELKKQGVYDNTRIIIVADHGANLDAYIADEPISIPDERREKYNPLLLVKDFYSNGKLLVDNTFMTNADVPLLALKGIVDNPVNPFTGNTLSDDYKKDGIYITTNHRPMAADHGKFQFNIKNDQWIFVKDNIFESSNWKKVEK